MPHIPQLRLSLVVLVQLDPQRVLPPGHEVVHWPLRHGMAPHDMPHLPQLSGSSCRLVQVVGPSVPPHCVWLVGQEPPHLPPEQTCPGPQGLPHDPQFWLSIWVLAQLEPQLM